MTTKDFLSKYRTMLHITGIEYNIECGKNHIANCLNNNTTVGRKIGDVQRKKLKSLFYQMFIDFQKISD